MPSTEVARRGHNARVVGAANGDVDVDKILADKGLAGRSVDDIPTFNMKIFGERFRVLKTINVLSVLMIDEDDADATAGAVRSIINLVHPDDQTRFKQAYGRQRDLSGAALNEIVRAMIEGAAAPNRSASRRASGRTSKRTTSTEPSEES